MKKKLVTVVLSAVMVLGSAIGVFATESADTYKSSTTTNGVQLDADDTISEATVATVEKNITVTLEGGSIKVSVPNKATLQAVSAAGATILKDKTFEIVELDLFKGATQLTALDSKIKVTLPVFENIKDAEWIEVFRLDDAKLTSLGKCEVKDGNFTFETDHFSTYVFVETTAPVTDTTEPEKTGDTAPVAAAIAIAALAAATVGVVSFKKKNA